jgi:dihydrofolate reductase
MKFELVIATSLNHVIGTDTKPIPWNQDDDLRRFKQLTLGHLVVYGRTTFETLPWDTGFPGRHNLVLTSKELDLDTFSGNFDENFTERCRKILGKHDLPPTVYILGGGEVYRQAFKQLDIFRINHTLVHTRIEDETSTTVPMFSGFTCVSEIKHKRDSKNEFDYSYLTWEKSNGYKKV